MDVPVDESHSNEIANWQSRLGYKAIYFAWIIILVGVIAFVAIVVRSYSEERAKRWVKEQGGRYFYEIEPEGLNNRGSDLGLLQIVPDYLRTVWGVEVFSNAKGTVLDNQFVSDLSPLIGFHDLKVLAIFIDILPEADLSILEELEGLQTLSIDHTCLSSEQVKQLTHLQNRFPKLRVVFGDNVQGY